jgi:hypothetical protein
VTQPGKVAEAEVCESGLCDVGNMLVRGDKVSFVSVERVRKSGAKRKEVDGRVIWTPEMPKADIELPRGFVVIHDTAGKLLSPCDLYIVKWYSNKGVAVSDLPHDELASVREYYGAKTKIKVGLVEIPEGPWEKVGRVQLIRYFRAGKAEDTYEHEFDPPVDLFDCARPLAWRLPLPQGCVVDDRGFVWP